MADSGARPCRVGLEYCLVTAGLVRAGHGAHELHDVAMQLGEDTRHYRIGLREVQLITDADEIGNRFAFRVNGKEIFMRGANWIPADALPARASPEVVEDLLPQALDANMNMLRVWGGGQYEPDWFYQMCSEKGLTCRE